MTTSLLVFGANGQVAREIDRIAPALGFTPTLAGRETLDLSTEDGSALIARLQPACVVNAAAYTAVDRAEQEPEPAYRLNAEVPGLLAKACQDRRIPFVHISTDYVFDGTKAGPYREDDPQNPMGVYGASKAKGEQAVLALGGVVVRTAWVYSAFGANFVKTMLRLAADRDEIGVVCDQHGCPTWAGEVAQAVLRLTQRRLDGDDAVQGVFHAAGEGEASWADFATAIFSDCAERGGPTARVKPITTAQYPTPARRPLNSTLDCSRLAETLGWRPGPWRAALFACLDELVRPR